jgi:predicted nucleic acid-binding protein
VTAFVLDNSVAMRWGFENTSNAYAEDILRQLASVTAAVAPVLWQYEVAAVLAKAERSGAITSEKVVDFLAALRSFDIVIDHDGTDRVLTDVYRLAITHRVTGCDSVYLELALRKNLPLATLDEDLARACRSAGGTVQGLTVLPNPPPAG